MGLDGASIRTLLIPIRGEHQHGAANGVLTVQFRYFGFFSFPTAGQLLSYSLGKNATVFACSEMNTCPPLSELTGRIQQQHQN